MVKHVVPVVRGVFVGFSCIPLNTKLNPICHLLALLGGATIVVVSRLRVNTQFKHHMIQCFGSAFRCNKSWSSKYYLHHLTCNTLLKNIKLCSLLQYISDSDMFINNVLRYI